MSKQQFFRHGVCMVLRHPHNGLLLSCHRLDWPDGQGWQFPQGGIEQGAAILDEARRELREEIGTDAIDTITLSEKSYRYFFPEGIRRKAGAAYIGQEHTWILARFCGKEADIRFDTHHPEFDSYEWITPDEALRRIVPFKYDAYQAALKDFGLIQ